MTGEKCNCDQSQNLLEIIKPLIEALFRVTDENRTLKESNFDLTKKCEDLKLRYKNVCNMLGTKQGDRGKGSGLRAGF